MKSYETRDILNINWCRISEPSTVPTHFLHKLYLHSGNITQQWKMDPLKMYFLLKIGIFHCYVSLPEGRCSRFIPAHAGVVSWGDRMRVAEMADVQAGR